MTGSAPPLQNAKPLLPAPPVSDLSPAIVTEPVQDRSKVPPSLPFGPTPLAAAFRFVEPTWRNYIMYVDMEARSGNLEARHYLSIWQSLPPRERQSHVPEQLCELASCTPADLIGWVSRQVWQEGSAKSAMCMSFMRDRVLDKTAEFAMASPDNARHTELFMKASGLLPASSGGRGGPSVMIPIFNQPSASSGAVALAGAKTETSPTGAAGLRTMDDEIVELSRIMQMDSPVLKADAADPYQDDEDDEDEDDEDDDPSDPDDDDDDEY